MKIIKKPLRHQFPCKARISRLVFSGLCMAVLTMQLAAQDNVPRMTLNIAYFGNNFWKPGFNAGLDYTHGVEEGSNRKGKDYIRQKFFNLDMGLYFDPGNHAGMLTHAGVNHRKYRENKINLHIGFSPLGIYRSFLNKPYELFDNAEVSGVAKPGRFYYAPTLSLGMGKFSNNVPGTGWFFEIDLTGLVPYTYVMFLVNTKLGLRIRLD